MNNLYTQTIVWRATLLGDDQDAKINFEKFCQSEWGIRIAFPEEIKIPDGRVDLLFKIHSEDISKFCLVKLTINGMRWLEDVCDHNIYYTDYIPFESIHNDNNKTNQETNQT